MSKAKYKPKLSHTKKVDRSKARTIDTATATATDIDINIDTTRTSSSSSSSQQPTKHKDMEIITSDHDHDVDSSTRTSSIFDLIAELCESILESPQQAFMATTDSENDDRNLSKPRKSSKKASSSSPTMSKMDQLLQLARGNTLTQTKQTQPSTGALSYNYDYDCDYDYIAQLAIMSLLVIYKDIIPSYRIRLPTTQEMSIKVTKEVQQLWDYERTLLHHYQQYLILLDNIWNKYHSNTSSAKTKQSHTHTGASASTSTRTSTSAHSPSVQVQSLAVTCILSMAELLKSAFHFNFRTNLFTAVIRQMNYRSTTSPLSSSSSTSTTSDATIRTSCCDAIQYVFINDHQGDVTLEITRQISKYMKDRDYKNISKKMLQTLYYIPLRVHVDEAMAAKIATQVNKKKRKRHAELVEIENEMKEGSTTVDKITLAKCQSDTLQIIILTYFRILKSITNHATINVPSAAIDNAPNTNPSKSNQRHVQELLPTALEGLAKYAHLINIDTVIDLLAVLRDLLYQTITNVQTTNATTILPLEAALNCILTAFQTIQGPGKEMKIDMKDYIVPLYNQIPRLCNDQSNNRYATNGNLDDYFSNAKNLSNLTLQCLTLTFIQRREYSNIRVAAFMKRILSLTLHSTTPDMSIPLLAFVRQLIQRYPNALQQMFENEQDVITEGQYRMDVSDPEHANPYATSAWECTLLKFHYNTNVQTQTMGVATCKMLNMPMECPMKLLQIENKKVEQLHIPFTRQQKCHPLLSNKLKDKRQQIRFITPRVKYSTSKNPICM